jgi:hypothetical protein
VSSILTPALALVIWSLVIWAAMVATRLPALAKARIPPQGARYTADLTNLPAPARDIADNYNHLMEQPTLFYALVGYIALSGHGDPINVGLAWSYVAVRVVHSLIQCTANLVAWRFYAFVASTVVLIVIAGREVATLFG